MYEDAHLEMAYEDRVSGTLDLATEHEDEGEELACENCGGYLFTDCFGNDRCEDCQDGCPGCESEDPETTRRIEEHEGWARGL